jgi:ribosome-binding protein aMBF1 (putative translation factor)
MTDERLAEIGKTIFYSEPAGSYPPPRAMTAELYREVTEIRKQQRARVGSSTPIGTHIRALRHERGWRLADLAARAGVSITYLSDVERGRTMPSVKMLEKMAAAFGLRFGFYSEDTSALVAENERLREVVERVREAVR